MPTGIRLDGLAIEPGSRLLSWSIEAGSFVGVVGAGGVGVEKWIRVLSGQSSDFAAGSVECAEAVTVWEGPSRLRARQTPSSLGQLNSQQGGLDRLSEALVATGLWDHRRTPVSELSSYQRSMASLIPVLTSRAELLVFPYAFESVDAWHQDPVRRLLQQRMEEGATILFASHRCDWLDRATHLLVVQGGQFLYHGSPDELKQSFKKQMFRVETHLSEAAMALISPLKVSIHETSNGFEMWCEGGAAEAAKLLLQGYGSVSSVFVPSLSLEEALASLRRFETR